MPQLTISEVAQQVGLQASPICCTRGERRSMPFTIISPRLRGGIRSAFRDGFALRDLFRRHALGYSRPPGAKASSTATSLAGALSRDKGENRCQAHSIPQRPLQSSRNASGAFALSAQGSSYTMPRESRRRRTTAYRARPRDLSLLERDQELVNVQIAVSVR